MKSLQLFDRLKQKKPYEKFMRKEKGAFLYTIFCILSSNEKEGDKIQFDFFLPESKKIGHSEYPFDEIKVQAEPTSFKPEPLDLSTIKIDLEDLWSSIEKIQLDNKDNSVITKIIGVLKRDQWDLTCTTQTLDILRIKLHNQTGECISYKKENLTNFIQIKKTDKKLD